MASKDFDYDESEVGERIDRADYEIRCLIGSDLHWPEPDETLTEYMKRHKAGRFFSEKEITTPHHKGIARSLGYTKFLAPRHLWPLKLIVLCVGDIMRDVVASPIRLRNLWRPVPYNMRVTGSSRARTLKGDHCNCCAGDFDFETVAARRKAEGIIRGFSIALPSLEWSIGMGFRTLHVGVLSPRGHRHWYYSGYKDPKVPIR